MPVKKSCFQIFKNPKVHLQKCIRKISRHICKKQEQEGHSSPFRQKTQFKDKHN